MIRDSTRKDASAIGSIIVASWQTAFSGIIEPSYPKTLSVDRYSQIMDNNIQHAQEKVFVYDDGIVKGFISGKPCGELYDYEIVGLYVHPDAQQQGVGGSLFLYMKEYLRGEGFQSVILWTLQGAKNNDFYRKHRGKAIESKIITIGAHQYEGVGFVFDLQKE